MLRVIRNHRRAAYNAPADEYEGCRSRRWASIRRSARRTAGRSGARVAGIGALALRRAVRLSQCADDAAGADRHHRSADGLRHHRSRARLRARQVQEAGRRRLFQDRQPEHRAGAAAISATPRTSARRYLAYVLGTLSLDGAPYVNRETLEREGLHRRRSSTRSKSRCRASSSWGSPSTPGRLVTRRFGRARHLHGGGEQAGLRSAARARLHAADRSTRPTSTSAAR